MIPGSYVRNSKTRRGSVEGILATRPKRFVFGYALLLVGATMALLHLLGLFGLGGGPVETLFRSVIGASLAGGVLFVALSWW